MMLMQESPMQGDKSLPLLIGQLIRCLRLRGTYLHTLLLYHNQSGIDPFDFIHQLFLADGSGLSLTKHMNLLIRRNVIGGWG